MPPPKNISKELRRKLWLENHRKKIERHRVKRRKKKKEKLKLELHKIGSISRRHPSVKRHRNRSVGISLPRSLDFEENYEITAEKLGAIRKAVDSGLKIKTIDFSELREISASAALVLASTVDQWREKVAGKIKANLPSWDESIIAQLHEMGYFTLLNIPEPQGSLPKSDVSFLQFEREIAASNSSGETAIELRIGIEKMVGSTIQKHYLFEGISEAVTNVSQHAYPESLGEQPKYWWVSASFNKLTRELNVTFYDRGTGIPNTLQSHRFFERFRDQFDNWKDSAKIKAAMEIGRTSSGLEERGKGLQNLLQFAKAHKKGKLSVKSLKGIYQEVFLTDAQGNQTVKKNKIDHEYSIGGTLIEWSVYI